MSIGTRHIGIVLWTVWVVLGAIFILRLWSLPIFFPDQGVGPIYVTPNIQFLEGVYSNNDRSQELKVLSRKIRLEPAEKYQISFLIKEVTGPESVNLVIDFYGDNYDFPEQQFQVKLKPGTTDKTITRTIPSGDKVPKEAELRIFFDSPTRVTISKKVRIIKENKTLIYTFLACFILIALFSMLYVSVNASKNGAETNSNLRRLQLFFVLIFLGLLVAPLCQDEFNVFIYKTLDENRNKVEKP